MIQDIPKVVYLDRLVGPTHHYGGLSQGNLASETSKFSISNPKKAALEGLCKMYDVMKLGALQMVLPPQKKSFKSFLKMFNLDALSLNEIYERDSSLLSSFYSSSAMWMANAATVTPYFLTQDHNTHITPANLIHTVHRSLESRTVYDEFNHFFSQFPQKVIHQAVPNIYSDEGAANSIVFNNEDTGVQLFCYGKKRYERDEKNIFLPRQTYEASSWISWKHKINQDHFIFAKQSKLATDSGVFHQDVIAMGINDYFVLHECAYENQQNLLNELTTKFKNNTGVNLNVIEIKNSELSIEEAVSTYYFNSQFLELNNKLVLLAPIECKRYKKAFKLMESLKTKIPTLSDIFYVDLNQSMRNGGGPACLRLAIPVSNKQEKKLPESLILTEELFDKLYKYIEINYPEVMHVELLNNLEFLIKMEKVILGFKNFNLDYEG